MRVVVTGSRDWTDVKTIGAWLSSLPERTRIAHGACRGADEMAGRLARAARFDVVEYPADWSLGRQAGPLRNRTMLSKENPNLVLAFPRFAIGGAPEGGSWDCIRAALELGIPVTICPPGSRP